MPSCNGFKPYKLVGIPLFHIAEDWCLREIHRRMLCNCDAVVTNTEFEAEFSRGLRARFAQAVGVGIIQRNLRREMVVL